MMDTGRQVRVEVCVDSLEHEASSIAWLLSRLTYCVWVNYKVIPVSPNVSLSGYVISSTLPRRPHEKAKSRMIELIK